MFAAGICRESTIVLQFLETLGQPVSLNEIDVEVTWKTSARKVTAAAGEKYSIGVDVVFPVWPFTVTLKLPPRFGVALPTVTKSILFVFACWVSETVSDCVELVSCVPPAPGLPS